MNTVPDADRSSQAGRAVNVGVDQAIDRLTDDYSRAPVPDSAAVSGGRIFFVVMSAGIALPILAMGTQLGVELGPGRAIAAAVLGGLFLSVIAALTSSCGARRRLTTYALISEAYGTRGGTLVNVLLGSSIWGWVGVNASMFGLTLAAALPESWRWVPVGVWTVLGTLFTLTIAVAGFRVINGLATAIVPLKLGLLLWTLTAALRGYAGDAAGVDLAPIPTMSLSTGVSAMIGAFIIGAIMQPDFCRFARTSREAGIAGACIYGIGFPAIVIMAALSASWVGEPDLIALMQTLGLGLAALVIVMLAAVSTNSLNLYSASLLLATLFGQRSRWLLTTIGATLGTALGLAGIIEVMIPWFVLMGAYAPALAGVYIAHDIVDTRWPTARRERSDAWHLDAFAAAALGVVAALLTQIFVPAELMALPAIASLGVSVVAYVFIRRFGRLSPLRTRSAMPDP
jgi:cytosine permease